MPGAVRVRAHVSVSEGAGVMEAAVAPPQLLEPGVGVLCLRLCRLRSEGPGHAEVCPRPKVALVNSPTG